MLLTATEAADRMGISKQLISNWYRRKRIERYPGKKYRWGDLVRVEQETRNYAKSSAFPRKPQLLEA